MFEVKLPARINVLGNPSDGNEGAHQTISAAVNVWGGVKVEASDSMVMRLTEPGSGEDVIEPVSSRDLESLEYGAGFDLMTAAVRALWRYSPEFREKALRAYTFPAMTYWTEIPRQSGIGGSTVLVLLTLLSMVRFFRLDKKKHNLYLLGELAQRAEEKELGITCGFADRYVPLFGDLAYIDYRGKLFHMPVKEEPYCTYEKLGEFVEDFPLVMCSTGVRHDSGDVHGPMRSLYLEEYELFRGDYEDCPFMVKVMKQAGDTAWKGKIALLEGDLEAFGELMNLNHRLVDEMMRHCGFTMGAGDANNRIIEAGLTAGALGAKLTGAGGGGSVFMLSRPGEEQRVADALKLALKEYGYDQGRVYIPSIVKRGGVVLETD